MSHYAAVQSVCEQVAAQIGNTPDSRMGLRSGWPTFDRYTRGFLPGKLYVAGARPGQGKTSWCTSLIANIAKRGDASVLMFSTELDEVEIGTQVVEALAGGVPMFPNRRSSQPEEMSALSDGVFVLTRALKEHRLTVRYSKRLTAEGLCQAIDEHIDRVLGGSVPLVLIDQANRIHREDRKGHGYAIATEEMLNAMEEVAGKTGAPVVLLSQLHRDAEGKKPSLANIKHSGAFEEFAHAVYLLHREVDEAGVPNDFAEMIIGKNRSGRIGSVPMNFVGESHFWSEREERYRER